MSNKLEIKIKAEENNTYSMDLLDNTSIAWVIEIPNNGNATYKIVFQSSVGAVNSVYSFINKLIINNVFKSINEIDKITVTDYSGTYIINGDKIKTISSNRSPSSDEVQINLYNLVSKDQLPFITEE